MPVSDYRADQGVLCRIKSEQTLKGIYAEGSVQYVKEWCVASDKMTLLEHDIGEYNK